jgi:peptide methionine sulfoxide reductase MsrB
MLSLIRYFSMIRLNESSGSCSNNVGHVSQHEPQLTQVARSIITFTAIHPDYRFIVKPI